MEQCPRCTWEHMLKAIDCLETCGRDVEKYAEDYFRHWMKNILAAEAHTQYAYPQVYQRIRKLKFKAAELNPQNPGDMSKFVGMSEEILEESESIIRELEEIRQVEGAQVDIWESATQRALEEANAKASNSNSGGGTSDADR